MAALPCVYIASVYFEADPNNCACPPKVVGGASIAGFEAPTGGRRNQLGVDINNAGDIPPDFTLSFGERNLLNALARRLITPRGFLFTQTGDEAAGNYGFDLRAYIAIDMDDGTLGEIEQGVRFQMLDDPRVRSAGVAAAYVEEEERIDVTIALDTNEGPFLLVVQADALTVTILDGDGGLILEAAAA